MLGDEAVWRDIPEERYTNAFLGYGPEDSHFVIELTYNYGVDNYDIGTGFGHFGIAVEDVEFLLKFFCATHQIMFGSTHSDVDMNRLPKAIMDLLQKAKELEKVTREPSWSPVQKVAAQ
ncbi:hypothetical protein LOK49_Contig770G00001 [Camellia lanceoleosa]|nr:hypothetical protein LOK49_Contig770G00001 [Camellia lanceoleosa]